MATVNQILESEAPETPHIFEGLSRTIFDSQDRIDYDTVAIPGVSEDVVRMISKNGNEPDWMLQLRLKSLEIFKSKPLPTWGPDLSGLNLDNIYYFAKPA